MPLRSACGGRDPHRRAKPDQPHWLCLNCYALTAPQRAERSAPKTRPDPDPGSGKTGLVMVLVEEALRNGIPTLMVDLKGDLPNLLFSFPMGSPDAFVPWIDDQAEDHEGRSAGNIAASLAAERDAGLVRSGISPAQVEAWRAAVRVRVLTCARSTSSRSWCFRAAPPATKA